MREEPMPSGAAQPGDAEYRIRVEPCPDRIRIEFNGTWIADSTRAVVLHETRLPPVFYIPADDVRMEFLEKTDHATHCPFKGNASYWTIKVGGATAENAVWAYEDPYEDARDVKGYLSFYPDRVSAIYEGDEEVPFVDENVDSMHANRIAGWLLRDAWRIAATDELVGGFCRCLVHNGVPIARMTVIVPTLHPQVFASVFIWRADGGEVKTILEPHDILHQPKFADSPFAPIIRGAGGIRRRLEGNDVKLDFPVLRELHAEGATDYVAMPFRFSDGQINVMSMTSFAAGGFRTAHLGNVYEVLPTLGRLFEVHAQRRTAVTLLETYLGRHTGRRVLDGQIRHGDGERIHAVIWFCDLRNSTTLAGSMEHGAYLAQLNRFFHAMAGAVIENGGEVLNYIGDAVLAIFPIVESARQARSGGTGTPEACRRAIRAVRTAGQRIAAANDTRPDLPKMEYGIGLHLGDVTYGNIGIPERLQFTVIGSAANEASRIEGMTKQLGDAVLVSQAFARAYPGKLLARGAHELKGVSARHELFALPAE
jgi:class 3 adenylate cyclase/uncharacterized protein (DUF427 family)